MSRPAETSLRAGVACLGALSSTSDGRNPASVLPAPVGAISSTGARPCQKLELMLARRPAAAGEPARERLRQQRSCIRRRADIHGTRHLGPLHANLEPSVPLPD